MEIVSPAQSENCFIAGKDPFLSGLSKQLNNCYRLIITPHFSPSENTHLYVINLDEKNQSGVIIFPEKNHQQITSNHSLILPSPQTNHFAFGLTASGTSEIFYVLLLQSNEIDKQLSHFFKKHGFHTICDPSHPACVTKMEKGKGQIKREVWEDFLQKMQLKYNLNFIYKVREIQP